MVLCISRDTPFAQSRFCAADGLDRVITLSDTKDRNFGAAYHNAMADGPLQGFLSRSVVVVGPDGKVKYTEQVPEIGQEPDYEAALGAL